METTFNGAEAIEVIERVLLAGMTLGIKMPRMEGYEVVRYLRETDKKIPVIIVSGYVVSLNEADAKDAYLMHNVQALFPKPVSSDELKPAVERWFGPPS